MKNIYLILTSFVSFFALSFLFISYLEKPHTLMADYEELLASGLIEKGWVPNYIPKSATDISEQHDLDTNRVDIFFKFKPSVEEMTVNTCTLLIENSQGKKYLCPPLEESTSILTLRKDGVGYYRSESDGFY